MERDEKQSGNEKRGNGGNGERGRIGREEQARMNIIQRQKEKIGKIESK